MNQIKLLDYEIRESDNLYRDCDGVKIFHLYVKNLVTDKESHIHTGEKTMYFLGSNIAKDVAEAEDLIKENKGTKILGCELYRQYYNMNEEIYCLFRNGYDLDVKTFLDGVKNQIGLLRYTSDANSSMTPEGEYTPATESCKSIHVFLNSSDVVYWQLDNGEWIAQFGFAIEIDDYAVTKFYFNEEPTDYKIRVAYAISQVEIDFRLNGKKKAEQTLTDLREFILK